MERSGLSPEDLAATVYQHIMIQLLEVFSKYGIKQVLLTGGGALNTYLTNLLKNKSQTGIIIPGRILIDFKEALVFAFLGLLRYRNEINCFASVTGASEDSVAGKLIKKAPE
jgi:anhydro-N-acetylmuramic acid kinase